MSPTPRQILETVFPYLKVAASYARQIQSRIAAQPGKAADSFLGAALTDADLSIQTLVEVVLLGNFPDLRFYGEEHEQSYNTKYFRSIELGGPGDYLVTLDPIDGTQFYLDGHANYQIILTVLNWDEFEAVLAITPATQTFCYAIRGEGCWQGALQEELATAQPVHLHTRASQILLGWGMERLAPALSHYAVTAVATDYSREQQIPNVNGLLEGQLAGVAIRSGKFIDGAALAFLVQEAGGIVTTLTGDAPPPLHQCENYGRPGLLIATSAAVHQDLLAAVRATTVTPA